MRYRDRVLKRHDFGIGLQVLQRDEIGLAKGAQYRHRVLGASERDFSAVMADKFAVGGIGRLLQGRKKQAFEVRIIIKAQRLRHADKCHGRELRLHRATFG